ncbi:hypothetical protein [Streptomyces dangxiongensis]|uniref:hypothetical protein n=1 Tax=Streptomyces dangxiongensis TaxID=1442032 RepID=UPI0013CECA82|nr:hypothetical protein [Streptomyces dangxiongensis]
MGGEVAVTAEGVPVNGVLALRLTGAEPPRLRTMSEDSRRAGGRLSASTGTGSSPVR